MKLSSEQRKGFCNITPASKEVVIAQLRDAEFRLKLHQLRRFNEKVATASYRW